MQMVNKQAFYVPDETLRDWFAGQALAGLLANPGGPIQSNTLQGWDFVNTGYAPLSAFCYQIADAMLAAREVRHDE